MFLVSAEANTSAGAPCCSWVTRSEEPPKLKVTSVPAWVVSNCWPRVVKVAFSEAAANTVSVWGAAGAAEPPPAGSAVVLQPAPADRSAIAAAAARVSLRFMTLLAGFR